jgi:hypothetical protein
MNMNMTESIREHNALQNEDPVELLTAPSSSKYDDAVQ